jgi:hypothetical protein
MRSGDGYGHPGIFKMCLKSSVVCFSDVFSLETIGVEGPMNEEGIFIVTCPVAYISSIKFYSCFLKKWN